MKTILIQILILSFFLFVQVNVVQATRIYSNIFQVAERGSTSMTSKKSASDFAALCASNKAHAICTNMGQSTKILSKGAFDCDGVDQGWWTCVGTVSVQCWADVYGKSGSSKRRPEPIRNYSAKDKIKGYNAKSNTTKTTTRKKGKGNGFDQSMRQINQDIQKMMRSMQSGRLDQKQLCRTLSNLTIQINNLQRNVQTSTQIRDLKRVSQTLSQLSQMCR